MNHIHPQSGVRLAITTILAFLLGIPLSTNADITGQWNFTDGLAAEIGQDLIVAHFMQRRQGIGSEERL